MDQKKEPQNSNALKTRINPVVVYCIIGAVVAFNVVLYLYVMDRLNQLDKQKAELLNSIKQYQEVPIPDLMQEPGTQTDEQIEKLKRLEKELDKSITEGTPIKLKKVPVDSKEPTGAKTPAESTEVPAKERPAK